MLGEVDVFDYVLAEKLGKTLGEVRAMPNDEYVEWRCYHEVRAALENPRRVV